jgi:hypothetical protein
VVSVLASGTQVRGFAPGRSRWIFQFGKSQQLLSSNNQHLQLNIFILTLYCLSCTDAQIVSHNERETTTQITTAQVGLQKNSEAVQRSFIPLCPNISFCAILTHNTFKMYNRKLIFSKLYLYFKKNRNPNL